MLVSMLIWKIKLFLLMFDVKVKCEKSLYMQAINISLIIVKCKIYFGKILRPSKPSQFFRNPTQTNSRIISCDDIPLIFQLL